MDDKLKQKQKQSGDPSLTVHRVHRLEGDDLGRGGVRPAQQLPQVRHVVVAEDKLLGAAVPDALDHGGVVTCVRVDLTSWRGIKAHINHDFD